MNDDTQALSVDELVEYCRTQAGRLSGHVETMSVETNDLLDEIDEDIAEIRTHLEERANSTEGPTASPTTTGPNDPQRNFTELEELETELKEKCVLQTALDQAFYINSITVRTIMRSPTHHIVVW